MIKRVKGHGRRATYVLGNVGKSSGWHVKLRPRHQQTVLENEAKRINWVRKQTTLPVTKTAASVSTPIVGLLLTRTVAGTPAHHLISSLGPDKLVQALSDGMALLHRESPGKDFSFKAPEWATGKELSVERIHNLDKLRQAGKKLHPGFDELTDQKLIQIIEKGPDRYDRRVFVHGDLCMPNMLMTEDGALTGLIDLGALHVGDPVVDASLLAWCINDNLGPTWSERFLNMYGLTSNDTRVQFYRLAYDLSLDFPDPWAWTMTPKMIQRRAHLEGVKG